MSYHSSGPYGNSFEPYGGAGESWDGRSGGRQAGGGRSHGGHGGGGRGAGRGSGYGNRSGRGGGPRPTMIDVKTNFFRLTVDQKGLSQGEWILYNVEIHDGKRVRLKDSNGEDLVPRQFKVVPRFRTYKNEDGSTEESQREMDLKRGSTPLSRRILQKLQAQLLAGSPPLYLVTDGCATAYAPQRLFSESEADSLEINNSMPSEVIVSKSVGVYGPADKGKSVAQPQAPKVGPYQDFEIVTKKDCDEADEEADRVMNAWFIVRLREVGTIQYRVVQDTLQPLRDEIIQIERLNQCIETIVKSTMISSMISCGKSPRMHYLPPESQQEGLLGRKLTQVFLRDGNQNTCAPVVGLQHAARFCTNGNVFLNFHVGISWFNLEKYFSRNTTSGVPIPILDVRKSTLAGIRIRDPHYPIEDRNIQFEIEQAFLNMLFHVKFTRPLNEEWAQKKREAGWTDKEIARKNDYVRRNIRMLAKCKEPSIVWAADDASLHCFDVKPQPTMGPDSQEIIEPPMTHTVASYFLERYNVKLRFPKMPIIMTSKGYYPVEFLFQAFDRAKGANSPEHVKHVLGFHDEFAADKKIDHLEHTLEAMTQLQQQSGQDLSMMLKQFNLVLDQKPLCLKAVILPEPSLKFENVNAGLRNGSWNLHNVKFKRPSDLASFAVVSFLHGSADDCMKNLFRVIENHGLSMPVNVDPFEAMQKLTVKESSLVPEKMFDALQTAIQRSKEYFLYDAAGDFHHHNVWFHSWAVNGFGETSECLVIPGPNGNVGAILPQATLWASHKVLNSSTNEQGTARIMGVFKNSEMPIDPFDFRWSYKLKRHEVLQHDTGEWLPSIFSHFVYQMQATGAIYTEAGIKVVEPVVIAPDWQVECPSIIFVHLPEKATESYHFAKLVSTFVFGIPSQCIVQATFANQRSPDQYCSNIALKLNTKLSSRMNGARAWDVDYAGIQGGVPWVEEVPTLVMGISLSKGLGQDSKTIVAASACLESGMQIAQTLKVQQKADIVADHLMRAMTKNLAIQYFKHTGKPPQRVIIYRDGSSDGNFEALISHELHSIRQAFFELNAKEGIECLNKAKCEGGCVFCTPPITFVVCLNQHNVHIVPNEPLADFYKGNVPSGTCVDDVVMPFRNGLNLATKNVDHTKPAGSSLELFQASDNGYDFLLTAQGGLKGTSKPVFYRVLLNENAVWKPSPPCTPLTKDVLHKITYLMSHQYGTATKSVRSIPVVYYSKRLANTAMGYFGYLIGKKQGLPQADDSQLVEVDVHDVNPEEERFQFVRSQMANSEASIDPAVKNELLPHFSPYEPRFKAASVLRSPFRPHISA